MDKAWEAWLIDVSKEILTMLKGATYKSHIMPATLHRRKVCSLEEAQMGTLQMTEIHG